MLVSRDLLMVSVQGMTQYFECGLVFSPLMPCCAFVDLSIDCGAAIRYSDAASGIE